MKNNYIVLLEECYNYYTRFVNIKEFTLNPDITTKYFHIKKICN